MEDIFRLGIALLLICAFPGKYFGADGPKNPSSIAGSSDQENKKIKVAELLAVGRIVKIPQLRPNTCGQILHPEKAG